MPPAVELQTVVSLTWPTSVSRSNSATMQPRTAAAASFKCTQIFAVRSLLGAGFKLARADHSVRARRSHDGAQHCGLVQQGVSNHWVKGVLVPLRPAYIHHTRGAACA